MKCKPTILLYNLSGSRGRPWRFAAKQLGIVERMVHPSEYNREIGTLFTSALLTESGMALGFSDPMLVMAYFQSDFLDSFLKAAYTAGADKGILKAVLTSINVNWTSNQLHEELLREQTAIISEKPWPLDND